MISTPEPEDDQADWREVSVWSGDWKAAERAGVDTIGPHLVDLEASGTITLWWFTRKGPEWRIRYLPAANREQSANAAIGEVCDKLVQASECVRWAHTIYEPPVAAFGGKESLTAAHVLFHADSRHALDHLAAGHGHHREIGLLSIAELMRSAGRDWYDQGQIWSLLTEERTSPPQPPSTADIAAVRHLLTGDPSAAPAVTRAPAAWFTAFHNTGKRLFDLDRHGIPTRGLNAVLAQHALYAWNRLGLPELVQGAMVAAATAAVLESGRGKRRDTNNGRQEEAIGNVAVVTTDLSASVSHDPAQLRQALADRILGRGTFRTAAVEEAFRTVPRELFLNSVDLAEAYRPSQVVTKRAADGTALSSASDPNLVATMAEDLDVRPKQNILEIGAATGINAGILSLLTGKDGHVTTIEIDQDLTDGAAAALTEAGYANVTAVCGDGALGWVDRAPYQRIIATVGVWDVSTAWWDQLDACGRMVVPLRLHGSGLTRSLALDLQPDGRLVSSYARVCGFVPMRGAAAHATTTIPLAEGVTLNLDAAADADLEALAQVLTHPAETRWIGINVTDHEAVEHLDLWLATHAPCFSRLLAGPAARTSGTADPALRWAGASLYDGESLAYIAARQHGPASKELGIVAHGPAGRRLIDQFIDLLSEWNHNRPARPVITAHRAGTADDLLGPGSRIERPDTRLTINW
ncbi:methyltransferase, FxLD system [Actinomadura meridiana]|uniref:Protein-L-isoaspartate O-methyltransferase n=1 Tax=Actinomadura meridiana TaxID=559626 RepID=A0ABP8CHA2_9ACTN